jgi:1-acyl-sn-glycerol-3-phosphate acyltransferase
VTRTQRRPTDGPPWAWRLAVRSVLWLLRGVFGWRIRARRPKDVPPPDEPLVVVFNHTSAIDAFLIADTVWRGLGHWVQPLVKEELFDVVGLGFLARRTGAIPVTRAEVSGREAAFGAAAQRLRDGGTLLLAPEGTVTHDGTLLPLRHGAARLAIEAGVAVLVVTHFGAQRGFSPVARLAERDVVVTMAFDLVHPSSDEDATSLTGRIAATMLDRSAELQAAYPQADPVAPWWPPYSSPGSPTAIARASLERYQESMAAAIAQARERAENLAEQARERAENLAEQARERAENLAEQARERAESLAVEVRDLAVGVKDRADEPRPEASDEPREAGEAIVGPDAAEPADAGETGDDAESTGDDPSPPGRPVTSR